MIFFAFLIFEVSYGLSVMLTLKSVNIQRLIEPYTMILEYSRDIIRCFISTRPAICIDLWFSYVEDTVLIFSKGNWIICLQSAPHTNILKKILV
jgi:hypothetical protein